MSTAIILGDTYQTIRLPGGYEAIASDLVANIGANSSGPFGLVYQWNTELATTDFSSGWRIPSLADVYAIALAIPGTSMSGMDVLEASGPLKSLTDWVTPNNGATDAYGFNFKPNSPPSYGGYGLFRTIDEAGDGLHYCAVLSTIGTTLAVQPTNDWAAFGIRLIRNSPEMNLYINSNSQWNKVSEQSQIDGDAWKQSSKIFVPSSGAWAQS